jgi:hypothetical protein
VFARNYEYAVGECAGRFPPPGLTTLLKLWKQLRAEVGPLNEHEAPDAYARGEVMMVAICAHLDQIRSKHVAATGHPIVSSLEAGEDWSWCHVDEVAFVVDADERESGS